ncbi:MAG: hypothetical protein NC124_02790 [Clostridium sp.]|nr:hypothetical protein [Clostridium sp.]
MKKTGKLQKTALFLLLLMIVLTTVADNTAFAASNAKKVTKLTVKTTNTMLNEGQVLTKSMLKKSLNVTANLKNGKTKKKYTLYNTKQIGKTIQPNSKGKYKVTITAGSVQKTVSIKVNRIVKIYFKNPSPKPLTEGGRFDAKAFKEDYTVYADYKKGADKEITTYTVSAPDVVTANADNQFEVTVKYGKYTAEIAIPVTKPAPETATTEDKTATEPSPENPTPNPTPDNPSVGENPTPTPDQDPEVPEVEEVEWLYYKSYGSDCLYSFDSERFTVWIYPAIAIPDDYTNIEELTLGVIFNDISLNTNIEDNLFIGHYNYKTKKVVSSFNKKYSSISNLPDSPSRIYSENTSFKFPQEWWNNKETVKFRVYAAIKRGDDVELVFGPVLAVQLDPEAE